MKYCSKCGQPNNNDAVNCSKCGEPFDTKNQPVKYTYHWGPGEIFLGILGVGGVIGLIWLFTVVG